MADFIKVFYRDDGIIGEEIIQKDYLRKVVKLEGNTGKGIRFEWFCPITQKNRAWNTYFKNMAIRDRVFKEYERYLTGGVLNITIPEFYQE